MYLYRLSLFDQSLSLTTLLSLFDQSLSLTTLPPLSPYLANRSMFLPYRLTPHLITFEGFRKGSTSFKATIRLGTGHKGSHKMKHTTVTNNLRRIDGSAAVMSCALMYSNAWYQPYSTLCVERLTVNEFGKDMLNAQ